MTITTMPPMTRTRAEQIAAGMDVGSSTVRPSSRGKNVGNALMRRLHLNLAAQRITTLRTEVSWDDFDLLGLFRCQGFKPSSRLCLACVLDPTQAEN